jgi:SulP family sulfate permease
MAQGVRFIIGTSKFQLVRQAMEPYLTLQAIGPIPIGILIGIIGGILTLLLLENKRFPAGLFIVSGGIVFGIIFGTHDGIREAFHHLMGGLNLTESLAFTFPTSADFTFALLALVLPQIPMTLGNAVIAYADLSQEYFHEKSVKTTYKSACISMALANFMSFFLGGMPLCHGAGGLAAHYRFGARTAGSNIIIGSIFVLFAIFFGPHLLSLLYLIPMAILGVLLLFAGSQLSLTLIDIKERKDLFVSLLMLGITLASNLAAAFIAGIGIAYAIKSNKLNV